MDFVFLVDFVELPDCISYCFSRKLRNYYHYFCKYIFLLLSLCSYPLDISSSSLHFWSFILFTLFPPTCIISVDLSPRLLHFTFASSNPLLSPCSDILNFSFLNSEFPFGCFYNFFLLIIYWMWHCLSFTSLVLLSFSSVKIFIMGILKSFCFKSGALTSNLCSYFLSSIWVILSYFCAYLRNFC